MAGNEFAGFALRRGRTLLIVGIVALATLAWAWLVSGDAMSMAADFWLVLAMWLVMMVAMMLPSAAPAILLYDRVRSDRGEPDDIAPSWLFMLGYLGAWFGFSAAAALAQLALVRAGWIGAMDLRASAPAVAGAALFVAGAYQMTPWKNACLSSCRSPAQFLTRFWRPGVWGALRLGLLHGAICIGCCWLLMILLFVGGVMNLAWVALLAALVAVEKVASTGPMIARWMGIGMMVGGGAVAVAAALSGIIAAVPPAP